MAAVARSRTPFDARAGALTRSLAGTGPAAHGVAPAGSAAVARNPPSTHQLFCEHSPLRRGIGSAWTARRVFDHAVAPAVRRGKAVCDGR